MIRSRKNRIIAEPKKRSTKPLETEDELKAKADAGIMAGLATTLEGINQKLDLLIKKDEAVHKKIEKPEEKPVEKPAEKSEEKPAEKLEEKIAEQ